MESSNKEHYCLSQETHALTSALRRTVFEPGVKLVRLLHHDPGRYSHFGGLTETARHTVVRKTPLLKQLIIQNAIILPRQARDEHRKS